MLRQAAAAIRRDHLLWVLLALGPVFALFTVIRVYPILETIRLSFYRYHPTQRNRPFIGFENYWRLLEDDAFRTALINTLQFCILAVAITLTLALTVAVLLRSIEKASPIYELLLYIPVVTPWVPASVIWKWIFDPAHGILNYGLSFLGAPRLNWLQDEHVILYAIVLVSVWKMLGYFVVVYGVGLRNIPDELLEAAELDGATPWQRLIHIVLPLMRPLILFTVIIATIIFFNVFAPVYVLTASAQGAPAYDFKVVVGEIYQTPSYSTAWAMRARSPSHYCCSSCRWSSSSSRFSATSDRISIDVQGTSHHYRRLYRLHHTCCSGGHSFFWVLMTALKTNPEINAWPPSILPSQPTLEHFRRILGEENFLRYIINSLIIALSSMTAILFTSSLAGFVFAKYRFPLRGPLFAIILATAIIPIEVYIIPLYLMVFGERMMNTYLALVFPFVIMTFGVFFMRQVIMCDPGRIDRGRAC